MSRLGNYWIKNPDKPVFAVWVARPQTGDKAYISDTRRSQKGADDLANRINEIGEYEAWVVRYPNRQTYLDLT